MHLLCKVHLERINLSISPIRGIVKCLSVMIINKWPASYVSSRLDDHLAIAEASWRWQSSLIRWTGWPVSYIEVALCDEHWQKYIDLLSFLLQLLDQSVVTIYAHCAARCVVCRATAKETISADHFNCRPNYFLVCASPSYSQRVLSLGTPRHATQRIAHR